jgi:glycosyltransferase involved in cell wall biosynthesis
MKITYYSHYFVPEIGAPSARIHDLAREWIRREHRVRVVTCFPSHPTGRIYPGYRHGAYLRESIDGIDVHRLWSYVTPNKGIVRRTLGHISFLCSGMVVPIPAVEDSDIIIGTSPTLFAAIAASRVARRHSIPFVMEVRDLWPALFSELGILNNRALLAILERMELALYADAAGIVTVTEAFRQNLIDRGVRAEKIFTIPNGADLSFWQPQLADTRRWRQALDLGERFVVLYIGAHGLSQGLETIITAAEMLRDDDSITFVFVGEGADKEKLVSHATSSGLTNVRFVDPVDKDGVRDFYAAADLCLIPLRDVPLFAGFIPSKMFEILAMGRPILASVRGEAAAILRESGAAEVVAPEDSVAIATAIRDARAHRLDSRAGSGIEFVQRNYSRQTLAARYIQFLERTRDRYRQGDA